MPDKFWLREASCGDCFWHVDVLSDGQGAMYPHTGWEKFARTHNLAHDCILNFTYEGDGEMAVKVFDEMACRRQYHFGDQFKPTSSDFYQISSNFCQPIMISTNYWKN